MNLPFFIARRYFLAKKSHNAINIISAISFAGVMVGTMALIIVLSVFNGFDHLVRSLINSFNPDYRVTVVEGKTFEPADSLLNAIRETEGVYDLSCILEDRALVMYDDLQTIAMIRGVENNYFEINGLDSMIIEGGFNPANQTAPQALIGYGIKMYLNVILNSPRQMIMYAPKQLAQVSLDAERALNRRYLQPAGVFTIEQGFDSEYIIVPASFAKELFDYNNNAVTAIEIKAYNNANSKTLQRKLEEIAGPELKVQNRYQQNEIYYKTMQAEKWAIFLILAFILLIASFNVIGTLTMLIIEKKDDIQTLRNMGAGHSLIKKIFLFEGWMISLLGSLMGVIAGLIICWIQIRFEPVKLQGSGSFVIDAYPVLVKTGDVFMTLAVVLTIGFFTAWYPIRYITKKYLSSTLQEIHS